MMYRFEITIGSDKKYLSIPFDIDKQWVINQIKKNVLRGNDPDFHGLNLNLDSLTKYVKRIHKSTFGIGIQDRLDHYKVFDTSKVQVREVQFYEGYQSKEILYELFKVMNKGDRILQIREYIERISREHGIELNSSNNLVF